MARDAVRTATRLILTGPRRLEFEGSALGAPGPGEVTVRTLWSGVSAGTELAQYRGTSPHLQRIWDDQSRVFRTRHASAAYPVRTLGYEEVGEIVEIASDVTTLRSGDLVYGTWGHTTAALLPATALAHRILPSGTDPRIGIFSHVGAVALNGVHDGRVRVGDVVAVFGLGVVGQIVCRILRLAGAQTIGIDPDPHRRMLASDGGCTTVLDPAASDVADAIRDVTRGRGADVCFEAAGSATALMTAVRAVAYASRVVTLGFHQGDAAGLRLGEEFHHNRIELVSSQISGVAPEAMHRWDKPRLWHTAIELQARGALDLLGLISHTMPFTDASKAFVALDEAAPGMLQVLLAFEESV